jgi:protein gp37
MNNVKKSIGWAHWTINPVKGICPVGCPYCYARKAYGRNCNEVFKDKSIRYDMTVWTGLRKAKAGDRIFVGSTIDLFHPLCSLWNDQIFEICASWPELTFIFLTKCPENLPKEFPYNCWVGVSVDGTPEKSPMSLAGLRDCIAKVKIISFEPLLGHVSVPFNLIGVNWVIIGAQTKPTKYPAIEWVKEIVEAANQTHIPVFLKNNLKDYLQDEGENETCFFKTAEDWEEGYQLRQEVPEVKHD